MLTTATAIVTMTIKTIKRVIAVKAPELLNNVSRLPLIAPSNSDPTLKCTCKHHLQPSYKRYTALGQTQPVQFPSILPSDHLQSKMAPNPTSAGDTESTSNVSAKYQEWPVRGVFRRVIARDEVRYRIEFSLEEPHSLMCPQHTVA